MTIELENKLNRLKELLIKSKKAAIAFSGGVDSSFLASVSYDVLKENSLAITLISPMNAKSEMDDAKKIANEIGIRMIAVHSDVIEEEVAENPVDRCYHCKKVEFRDIIKVAFAEGFAIVYDGSNADDDNDYRPGMKALNELKIQSPLKEAGLTKQDIRDLSKSMNLRTWEKPALACLASRIPYGESITREKLRRVEEAEDFIRAKGIIQFRVRSHGTIARIEIAPEERVKLFDTELLDAISKELKAIGFSYVAMELGGYKMGNMNLHVK